MEVEFDYFPNEIFLAIEELLTCGDLLALARCNRQLANYFLPALWRHGDRKPCGRRALFWAVSNGQATMLRRLISEETDLGMVWHHQSQLVDLRDLVPSSRGCRSSCSAPCGEAPTQSEMRHMQGNDHPWVGWSLVQVAAAVGNVDALAVLLNRRALATGGCLNLCDCRPVELRLGQMAIPPGIVHETQSSWTALHIALCRGHVEAAKLLFRRGHRHSMQSPLVLQVRPDPPRQALPLPDEPPLHLPHQLLALMLQGPIAPPPPPPPQGEARPPAVALLHGACMAGRLDYVRWLLGGEEGGEAVVDIDARDDAGQTALCYAYLHGHWDCFHYLVGNGAKVSLLTWAPYPGQHTGLQFLLLDAVLRLRFADALFIINDMAIDPDFVGCNRRTQDGHLLVQLCDSVWSRSRDTMEDGLRLLDRIIQSLEGKYYRGKYLTMALSCAAGWGNAPPIRPLVAAGAQLRGEPDKRETAAMLRVMTCRDPDRLNDTLAVLLELGADPNVVDAHGRPPLWSVWDMGTDERPALSVPKRRRAIELLLNHGARPYRGLRGRGGPGEMQDDVYANNMYGDDWSHREPRESIRRTEWWYDEANTAAVSEASTMGHLRRSWRPTTPLDRLFHGRDIVSFDSVLNRAGGKERLGQEDILSLWYSLQGQLDKMKLLIKVIDLDVHRVIAKHTQSNFRSLLSKQPLPRELIYRLLDHGADPDDSEGFSVIAQAINRNLDTALIRKLINCGADPRALMLSKPVLTHILGGTYTSVMGPAQLFEVVGLLLDAGLSIYESLESVRRLPIPVNAPQTYLGHALFEKDRNPELVKLFLEREPLHLRPQEDIVSYLRQIFAQRHVVALRWLVSDKGDPRGVVRGVIQLYGAVLARLLAIGWQEKTVAEADAQDDADCATILLRYASETILNDYPNPAEAHRKMEEAKAALRASDERTKIIFTTSTDGASVLFAVGGDADVGTTDTN